MIINLRGKSMLVLGILALLLLLSAAHSILQDRLLQGWQTAQSSTSPCLYQGRLFLALAELRASQELRTLPSLRWDWPFSPNYSPSRWTLANPRYRVNARRSLLLPYGLNRRSDFRSVVWL